MSRQLVAGARRREGHRVNAGRSKIRQKGCVRNTITSGYSCRSGWETCSGEVVIMATLRAWWAACGSDMVKAARRLAPPMGSFPHGLGSCERASAAGAAGSGSPQGLLRPCA